jgi:hypothetical protein
MLEELVSSEKHHMIFNTPKRILQQKPIGTRTTGRPRKRWIASVEEDLQIMGVRQWRKQCEERGEWKKSSEKAKTHSGW